MKSAPAAPRIARGYARGEKDELRLKAAGVKTIYREDRGETLDRIRMRSGEALGVVDGLLAFGAVRRDMRAAVTAVHKMGAIIADVETGKTSRKDGFEMLDDALSPARPSPEYMAKLAQKRALTRHKGRMPKAEALVIWRNPKFSTAECIDLMKGWKQATAYTTFGKRFAVAGRRPKSTS